MTMTLLKVRQSLNKYVWNMAEKIGMNSGGEVVTNTKQFVTQAIENPKAYCFILEHSIDNYRNYDERGRTMSQAYQAECIEANHGHSLPPVVSKNGVEMTVAQVHHDELKNWRRKTRRTQVLDKDSTHVLLKSYNSNYREWFGMDKMPSSSFASVNKKAPISGFNEAGEVCHGHEIVRSRRVCICI